MEILRIQEKVTIDDIVRIKDGIQICQDCDSINKIISTGDILAQKSLIMKKFIRGKVVYQKFPSGLS